MSDRLTRGLAAMLPDVVFGEPVVGTFGLLTFDDTAAALLATPTGKALAEMVEAAEAWEMGRTVFGGPSDRLADAVDAYRAATEP